MGRRDTFIKINAQRAASHVGERFGRLTVTGVSALRSGNGRTLLECRCDCGGIKLAEFRNLNKGNVSSCGCWRREAPSLRFTTHGLSKNKEYRKQKLQEWLKANPERKRLYGRLSYRRHREARLAWAKVYRSKHPERARAAAARYRDRNRDLLRHMWRIRDAGRSQKDGVRRRVSRVMLEVDWSNLSSVLGGGR